jgi:histidine triad (HIT) family protein
MEDCIFCDIIKGKLPSATVYEDKEFVAFKDIKPLAPVHIIIVPKEHIASINELENKHKEMVGGMLLVAKKLAKEYETSEGYKLAFNTGRKGGQLVDHLHLHLMGGWKEEQ